MSQTLIDEAAALGFPTVARSSEGRALYLGRFAPDAPGPPLLVVAGVHGDEPTSVEAALELCAYLYRQPPTRPVLICPVLNPDGLLRGQKDSARDVDLNRNFPAKSFSREGRPGYFPGERPLSEPETRALADVVIGDAPVGIVAVHAPLACVNPDGPALDWANAVSGACGWPVREDIGYPTPGSLGSWAGRDLGLPVLTIELPPGPYARFRDLALAALVAAINSLRMG